MDNLDWDVLEHPSDRDTITEYESTCPLPNSLPSLVGKSRIVKDYGLRNGNADLISNPYIAEGEIAAVFGETSTIWGQDDVGEFDRIATQQNTTENAQQFEFYVS